MSPDNQDKKTKNPHDPSLPKLHTHSKALHKKANHFFPGGVNTPSRSFVKSGHIQIYAKRGKRGYLYDYDGNRYLDYVLAQGPLILGHGHPVVSKAVKNAISKGSIFSLPNKYENMLAEIIISHIPFIEKIRFVNSGTEAVLNTIRLAKAYTNRNQVGVFDVGYHGYASGLHDAKRDQIIPFPYNNLSKIEALFHEKGSDLACIIMEPVAANMGVIPPIEGIHAHIRKLCDEYGVVLIFDEVVTGFRFHLGAYSSLVHVTPDLITLGKIIGGGYPIGGFGGKKEIMNLLAPIGQIYQGGTFSGHLISMVAGYETIRYLKRHDPYDQLTAFANQIKTSCSGILPINQMGPMFSLCFTKNQPNCYQQAIEADNHLFQRFHETAIDEGILFPPTPTKTSYICTGHSQHDIDFTIETLAKIWDSIQKANIGVSKR